jgi:hypothetical protein
MTVIDYGQSPVRDKSWTFADDLLMEKAFDWVMRSAFKWLMRFVSSSEPQYKDASTQNFVALLPTPLHYL